MPSMPPCSRFPTAKWIVLALSLPLAAFGDEAETKSESETKLIRIPAVIEAVNSAEIQIQTEHFDSFVIKRIVSHGREVQRGENLLVVDREEIDKKIKDAEVALRLSELALEGDALDYDLFLKTQNLDQAVAEQNRRAAQQEYDNFVEVDRERSVKSAAFNLKSSRESLENVEEELKQLEQMYKEDDLTEESEEIVLKRAKQAVESARFRYESAEIQSARTVEQVIPRSSATQDDALARADLAFHNSRHSAELARRKRDIEMKQKKEKFRDEERSLAELNEDRKRTVVVSPIDGLALHGKLTRGRLGDKPSTLEPESKVAANQILLTVVDPNRLQIRVDVSEENLGVFHDGAECKIEFKAFPDLQASGTVKSVSNVPYAADRYDGVVTIRGGKSLEGLLPTMTCELLFPDPNGDAEADEKADKQEEQADDDSSQST